MLSKLGRADAAAGVIALVAALSDAEAVEAEEEEELLAEVLHHVELIQAF